MDETFDAVPDMSGAWRVCRSLTCCHGSMASTMVDHRAGFEEIYDAYSGLILADAARRTNDAEDVLEPEIEVDGPRGEVVEPPQEDAHATVVTHSRMSMLRLTLVTTPSEGI